mgnify:CR=1 FL=1
MKNLIVVIIVLAVVALLVGIWWPKQKKSPEKKELPCDQKCQNEKYLKEHPVNVNEWGCDPKSGLCN